MVTPVKGKSTRPPAMSATKADASRLWSADTTSRPATAKKADALRTPFSPLSVNDSVISSASESRETARLAKMKSDNDRINKVAQLKAKWAEEKERKASLFLSRREQDKKRLQEDNQMAADLRKRNLDKQREIAHKEKQASKEQLSASLKARAQLTVDLEQEAKAKRRISVFLNGKMRKRALAKEAQLEVQQKEEEKGLLDSRRTDCLLVRQARQLESARKRESLANHTLRAAELRKKEEEIHHQLMEEEKALLELRHLNWEDDQAAREERERLRRESLAYRLDKWRVERDLTQSSKEQQRVAEEMDRELQSAAREDMQEYQIKCSAARRQSLSYRLDKARQDRDFEHGQKALMQMVQEEEKRVKEGEREDVQLYREKILEARRMSMQYRSQAFVSPVPYPNMNYLLMIMALQKQEKMRQEGEKSAERQAADHDYEMRRQAWKDVHEYRVKQREEARRSLAFRLADAHRQQETELTMHEDSLRKMHLDLLCKREDFLSQREAAEEEAIRRRRSIALRLESWREVRMAEEKMKEKDEMEKEEDALFREMDREELIAAKLTCELMEKRDAMTSRMLL